MATNKNSKKSLEYRAQVGKLSKSDMEKLVEKVRARKQRCREMFARIEEAQKKTMIYDSVINAKV